MYRITLHNLFYDCKIFFRQNRGKFALIILVAIAGFVLGISGAIAAFDAAFLKKFNSFSVILLISGKKTLLGYFLGRLLQLLCLNIIMLLLSFRMITSFLNFAVTFFFCFFSSRNIAISVMVLKIGFLPVTILCLIPAIFIYASILCSICVITIDYSYEFGSYNSFNIFYGVYRLAPICVPHLIIYSLISLAEAILVTILTLGLSV